MRKLTLVLLFVIFSTLCFGQRGGGHVGGGYRGGYNSGYRGGYGYRGGGGVRVGVGFGYGGFGYGGWGYGWGLGYWPSAYYGPTYDYGYYPYYSGYVYAPAPAVYSAPVYGPRVVVVQRFVNDGQWHHFGR
jgi:hypothetical protein